MPTRIAKQHSPFDDEVAALTDEQFVRVASYIEQTTGIRVPEQKRDLVRLRLVKRVRALALGDVDEYVRYALGPGEGRAELTNLVDVITTNKTSFFREEDHFDHLRQWVLPTLLRRDPALGRDHPLVVWSAGCASGEEAYTLAIVLAEYQRTHGPIWFEIHGSDICAEALRTAVRAVYPEEAVAGMSEETRRRYVLRSRDRGASRVRMSPTIRRSVVFERANLLHEDPPFAGRPHVVFCRNVLIYFSRETQYQVLTRITAHMPRDGYVFVGHAEMLHGLDLPLESIRPTVYRRT